MPSYVIMPDIALRLAAEAARPAALVRLLAPTLLRSHVLSELYASFRRGEITRREADGRLEGIRRLRIRLLGDRVLQKMAWTIADQLGWADTLQAEYLALARIQADALVTTDALIVKAARGIVALARYEDILIGR